MPTRATTTRRGSVIPPQGSVRLWLWTVAVMILAMVVVGGATRLTGSGLSITEWKPVSGVIPPLTPAAWQAEFARYQTIPQYRVVFPDMTVEQFKSIFYWEWTHRLLGRLIGLVVAVPLAWFWWRGALSTSLKWKLIGLLALGGLQGLIGWWMVKSGLSERTEVSQYRLAIHLVTASLTLALAVWYAESLSSAPGSCPGRLRATATVLLCGVVLQLGLGALVAGLRAGRVYNTWPMMGGTFVPGGMLFQKPIWRNLVENTTTVQFDHRLMAYVLLALAAAHTIDAGLSVPRSRIAARALLLLTALLAQALIGIATLLWSVPLGAALLHQGWAMVVLAIAVAHRVYLRRLPAGASGRLTDPGEVIGYAGVQAVASARR